MKMMSLLFFLGSLLSGRLHAEAPVNDDRANATTLTEGVAIQGTLAEATGEIGEPGIQSVQDETVWYQWTAPSEGSWQITVRSKSSGIIPEVYLENSEGDLNLLASGSRQKDELADEGGIDLWTSRFRAREGKTYWIQVRGYDREEKNFELQMQAFEQGSEGDHFEDAPILVGLDRQFEISTFGASTEEDEPPSRLGGSTWRKWVVPAEGYWIFRQTPGYSFDLWRGNELATLESVESIFFGDDKVILAKAVEGEVLSIRFLSSRDANLSFSIELPLPGDFFDKPIDFQSLDHLEHHRNIFRIYTYEPGEPPQGGMSQWWTWEAPADGQYEIDATLPDGNPDRSYGGPTVYVDVFVGDELESLVIVPGIRTENPILPMRFFAKRGVKYRIRNGFPLGLSGRYNIEGDFSEEVVLTLRKMPSSPPNDVFEAADDLGKVASAQTSGSNFGATAEAGEKFPDWRESDSVWTRWTAPGTGDYEFHIEGDVGLRVEILRGSELALLESVRETVLSTFDRSYRARLRFPAVEDEIYYVRVTGDRFAKQGIYSLNVRQIERPANDDRDQAVKLSGDLPLEFSGDTRDGTLELPVEDSLGLLSGYEVSSIWWSWTAPETGFYVLSGDGDLGISGNWGASIETQSVGHLYFEAEGGKSYEIFMAQGWDEEREVSLSLDVVAGLDHLDRKVAVELGSDMTVTSSAIAVLPGTVYGRKVLIRGAAWFRWTPERSGLVLLETTGSSGAVDLEGYRAVQNSIRSTAKALEYRAIRQRYDELTHSLPRVETERGFLRNRWLARPDKFPTVSRSLMEVEAGETYFLEAAPRVTSNLAPQELVDVVVNVRQVGIPPELEVGGLTSALSEDGRWLSVELLVESLNGFAWGGISWFGGTIGFGEGERIWGTSARGVYRVLIPWSLEAGPGELNATIHLIDQMGVKTELLNQAINLPAISVQDPLVDFIGPELMGVIGGAREIQLGDEAQFIEIELAIRDDGGSGFEQGEIFLPGEWEDYGGLERRRIPFGSEQRVRGDSKLGIYKVAVKLPRWSPPGDLRCQLRDRAGNLGGIWEITNPKSTYGKLNPLLPMSLKFTREMTSKIEAPTISEISLELLEGRISTSANLAHAIGIYGGQVVLLDEIGTVVTSVEFTPENLIAGSEQSSRYQLEIPLAPKAIGRNYHALWIAMGADGGKAERVSDQFVTLPDLDVGDERPPSLFSFAATPTNFELAHDAGVIEVTLAAEDERPGVTAEVVVLDEHSREIGRGSLATEDLFLTGTVSIPLSQDSQMPGNLKGRIIVILTDASGVQEIYGGSESRDWAGKNLVLTLNPDEKDALNDWSLQWLGQTISGRDNEDPDHDGWSNLMEFAMGTDPTRGLISDPLVGEGPIFRVQRDVATNAGIITEATTSFRPAPWFFLDGGRVLGEGYEVLVEASDELQNWTPVEVISEPADAGRTLKANEQFPPDQRSRYHRLKIRKRQD